ncbi:hypothetical protein ACFQ9X_05165 [Catenulispora yoronensis]
MTDTHMAASASGPIESGAEPEDRSTPRPAVPAGQTGRGSRWRRTLRRPGTWIPLALLGIYLVLWTLVLARPTFLTSFDLWVRDRVQDSAHADLDGAHRWRLIKHTADLGGSVAVPGGSGHIQLGMVLLGVVALLAAAVRRSWRPVARRPPATRHWAWSWC